MVEKSDGKKKQVRAERRSRSVLLHGYGGAMLRIFGTYQLDDDGKPEKIVVRAYHRVSKSEPWAPSDPTVLEDADQLEDEIRDWEIRATAAGYKRTTRRGSPGQFGKDTIPPAPTAPKLRPGTFTKGGIPDPMAVRHGGGRGGRR